MIIGPAFLTLLLAATPAAPRACWGHEGGETPCEAGGNLRSAKRVEPSALLRKALGKDTVAEAFTIDIDSDGKPDFVAEVKSADGSWRTCLVDSTGAVRSCEKGAASQSDGFEFYWFAQLDDDPMLELFRMEGEEDGSDYAVQKIDPKTWKRTDLFKLVPAIRADEKDPRQTFWGYPWDVRDVPIAKKDGVVRLLAAPFETLCGAGGIEDGAHGVVVFFSGKPTQGEPSDNWVAARKASKWIPLKDVAALARAAKPCPEPKP